MVDQFPTKLTFSAENDLREAIAQYYLLGYNFPDAASRCVMLLFLVFEHLLKENYQREKGSLFNVGKINSVNLIAEYPYWNSTQRDAINWLRIKRNVIAHKGELDWEEKEVVQARLAECLLLVGQLLTRLSYSLRDIFALWEVKPIRGEKPNLEEAALALIRIALKICDELPDVAVEMANEAYDCVFRWYAFCWNVVGWDQLEHHELIAELAKIREETDDCNIWPEAYVDEQNPLEGGQEFLSEWFAPPKTLHGIQQNYPGREPQAAPRAYVQKVFSIINSYLEFAPLYNEPCIRAHWRKIIRMLKERAPGIEIPSLDRHLWNQRWCFQHKLAIPTRYDVPTPVWDEYHKQQFLNIVEELCGKLPEDVQVLSIHAPH